MTDYAGLFSLHGRRACVIGAGSGIGREIAQGLAAWGADVVCADRDLDAARETSSLCRAQRSRTRDEGESARGNSEAAPESSAELIDVTARDQIREAPERFGHPQILVHTAAMNVRRRILDYTDDELENVTALNLTGTFRVLRAFGGSMVERGRGSMVFLSSIRARVVEPGQGVYGATKAGLESLMRSAASEFSSSGVRVNAIAPGVVTTPLTQQVQNNPEWFRNYAAQSALGRWSEPSELVGAAVYLTSDAASYVTGSVLAVDGGWTAIDGGTSELHIP